MSFVMNPTLPVTEPYWAGLREGELRLQHCQACQKWVFYPRKRCNHCLSDQLVWQRVDGPFNLYTFCQPVKATAPDFVALMPMTLIIVELPEQEIHLPSLLLGDTSNMKIGMPLTLQPTPLESGDKVLPLFTAAQPA